jgi:hypothetical protein
MMAGHGMEKTVQLLNYLQAVLTTGTLPDLELEVREECDYAVRLILRAIKNQSKRPFSQSDNP